MTEPDWIQTERTAAEALGTSRAAEVLRDAARAIVDVPGEAKLPRPLGRALAAWLRDAALEAEEIGPNPRAVDVAGHVLQLDIGKLHQEVWPRAVEDPVPAKTLEKSQLRCR